MTQRFILLILTVVLMSNCAVGPTRLKAEDTVVPPPHGVGLALAGGGTKAASYAMGVLAAVADDVQGFKQINAISSVSGGGYSAFYLYSKLIVGDKYPKEQLRPVKDYFEDCLPDIYEDVLPRPYKGFPPLCNADNYDQYRFQQFVRCRQDILENDCKQQLGRHDRGEYAAAVTNTAGLLGASLLMAVPSLVANTVFDLPINMSPTRDAYMEGIGTAYGLYPKSAAAIHETSNIINICNDETFLNCENRSDAAHVKRKDELDFKSLRKLTSERSSTIPVWYINATASKSRSIYGWAQKGRRDFSKYTLKMSPSNAVSGFYGQVPEYENVLDLLDGVTSAAAFFDANETSFKQPLRMALALGQHIFTLDWGKDIPNPTVNPSWRVLHNILPVGLYYIDSSLRRLSGAEPYQYSGYIRLLDGGNNDDLGAYTLIEAGMKHIIISDHAYDGVYVKKGDKVTDTLAKMDDVCMLQNEIALRSREGEPRKLVIPGLKDLPRHCLSVVKESECCDKSSKGDDKESNHGCNSCETVPGVEGTELRKGGYSILGWKYNVLLGCITSQNNAANTCNSTNDIRVYVIKPTFNLEDFKIKYLEKTQTGKYAVQEKACSDRKIPGVCEVAAYLADWYNHADKDAMLHPFPQNSTVAITFASTGKIYGAYRELARWHMHDALEALILTDEDFNTELKNQAEHQIERKVIDE